MQSQTHSFYHLGIAPKMLEILSSMKFVSPTAIQHQAIPIALEGKDLVGIAQTGTGKTLAFGIPMVQRLSALKGNALILAPTRELAQQIEQALSRILQAFNLRSVVLIGGVSMHHQIQTLRKRPRVIVATPGRLIDHLQQRTASLQDVEFLVLDEADRMFDMGFAPQVKEIIRSVPKNRQTMLFSATMPPDIMSLATQYMKLPIQIEIAPSGTVAEKVTQEVFVVKEESKKTLLRSILEQYRGSVLMFIRTRIRAKKITRVMRDWHQSVAEIHSDRSMAQRKQAIEGFKSSRFRILVATDIASRGIDVTGIELVINYDLPDDIENYVHRIGRTGRAGHEGHAITFATPDEGREIERIERLMHKPLPIAKHPDLPEEKFRGPSVVASFGKVRRGGGSFRSRRPFRRR